MKSRMTFPSIWFSKCDAMCKTLHKEQERYGTWHGDVGTKLF